MSEKINMADRGGGMSRALAVMTMMAAAMTMDPHAARRMRPSIQYRAPVGNFGDGKDQERKDAAEAKRKRRAAKLMKESA